MWVRDILPAIREFKIFDHGRLPGFEAIRIYYALEADALHIIRILHGKRDVKRILQTK
jgi:plasmid stabilization system protein ParE